MLADFVIVGAMKCGTSTLAAQLQAQPGIFMTDPKEPNFFSDDAQYRRGMAWYENLFAAAAPGDLKGEASTHYTKLPTYPDCIDRMAAALKAPKLIYMVRNPLVRAVSHYIHGWTMGEIRCDLETALEEHPELISYGCYGRQIAPFVRTFGAESILLASQEEMKTAPQDMLARICRFLDYDGDPLWQVEQAAVNVSADRVRQFPMHKLLIENPVAKTLRKTLVPQGVRDRIKRSRQMADRPDLPEAGRRRLEEVFAQDFEDLCALFPDARAGLAPCYPFLADG